MSGTLRFEPLHESHLPEILEIEIRVNAAPWSERSFRNELGHHDAIFRVARLQDAVVGYAGLWKIVDEAHITTVAVHPDHQRHGFGRRLVVEILELAKDDGMICATLEVRAGNEPAIRLYESLGFRTAAVRKGYYPDNREDALVMWLHNMDRWSAP